MNFTPLALRSAQKAMRRPPLMTRPSRGAQESTVQWPKTAQILKKWFRERDARDGAMAFPNVRRAPLTRFAIHLLLRRAVQTASTRCPSLKSKRVSPHVIRHGTAMALLQVGVAAEDLRTIGSIEWTAEGAYSICSSRMPRRPNGGISEQRARVIEHFGPTRARSLR